MVRKFLSTVSNFIWNICTFGFQKKYEVPRYGMYRKLENLFSSENNEVLSISHSNHLAKIIGLKNFKITEANYPQSNILNLKYPDNTFDFVISDQVFEHIDGDPQKAFDECMRVLKVGGIAVHTTCFMTAYHGPGDYWRWSFEGLKKLAKDHLVIQAEQAGSPVVHLLNFLGLIWAKVPDCKWHPFNYLCRINWPSWSNTVWELKKDK